MRSGLLLPNGACILMLALAVAAVASLVDAASVAVSERGLEVAKQAFLEMQHLQPFPGKKGAPGGFAAKNDAPAPPAARAGAPAAAPTTTTCGGNCPRNTCIECKCGTTVNRITRAMVRVDHPIAAPNGRQLYCFGCMILSSCACVQVLNACLTFTQWNAEECVKIAEKESHYNVNASNRNRNGSYDVGLMQVRQIVQCNCVYVYPTSDIAC